MGVGVGVMGVIMTAAVVAVGFGADSVEVLMWAVLMLVSMREVVCV